MARPEPQRGQPRDKDDDAMPVTRKAIRQEQAKKGPSGALSKTIAAHKAAKAKKKAAQEATKTVPGKPTPPPPKKKSKVVQADLFDDNFLGGGEPEDDDDGDADDAKPGPKPRTASDYVKKLDKDAEEAVEQAERIQELIEEIPERVKEKARGDFFESIYAKAASIGESVEKYGNVTDKQQSALDNMEEAVKKWHPEYRNR